MLATLQQQLKEATARALAAHAAHAAHAGGGGGGGGTEPRSRTPSSKVSPASSHAAAPGGTMDDVPPETSPTPAVAAAPAAAEAVPQVSPSSSSNNATLQQHEDAQKNQLIAQLHRQIEELRREQAAFAPAEQVLFDAAGSNAVESSKQLEEATEMIQSLRHELEDAKATAKEHKSQLNRALRERVKKFLFCYKPLATFFFFCNKPWLTLLNSCFQLSFHPSIFFFCFFFYYIQDRAVDETNRDADKRVKRAIEDAKKAQNAVYEQKKELTLMENELIAAKKAQKIAEDAFDSVGATEIGEEDIHMSPRDYARGSGGRAARVMRKSSTTTTTTTAAADDLDESYGADDFSDEDGYGGDEFD